MVRVIKIFVATIVVLGLVFAALPALLQGLDVPSFSIGNESFLLLSWRNDASGTGIRFNLLPFCLLALVLGLIVYGFKRQSLE